MEEREIYAAAVEIVRRNRGKLEVKAKVGAANREELSVVYTPGVAEPTRRVRDDHALQFQYTNRSTNLAIVTDGSAVLGLGNIGPEAAMVVMEGKGVMLKEFAGADPVPLCLSTQDTETIIATVKAIEPSFGFIFLEDISAPRCFEIVDRLSRELSIPVFHDDQEGTAVALCAAIKNMLRLTGDRLGDKRIVVNGAGAAGLATAKLIREMGGHDIVLCDKVGVLTGSTPGLDPYRAAFAAQTDSRGATTLTEALRGADILIGLSVARVVTQDMVRGMRPGAAAFCLANPDPEILPPDAKAAGARFTASGRFDYPNTINNLHAFPGIVRGTMEAGARQVTLGMKLAAVDAIAGYVPDAALADDFLMPEALDPALALHVADRVAAAARSEGVARGGKDA
ncbi:MAG: NAD-dependent malic enzyme [Desulfovibrio sp.]|jgi:malate dehydrogenase (oxaloacetate-decarboxylating)|nr:NAD-dependent malic enzyme [Desulfovibrio sp.]